MHLTTQGEDLNDDSSKSHLMSAFPSLERARQAFASQRIQRLSREGVWVVLGQVGTIAGSLIGVRILTELLDATSYGQVALGLTLANLANQTVLGPLGNGINRFYASAAEQADLAGYRRSVARLVAKATVVMVALLAISDLVLVITREWRWVALATISLGFAIVSGYNSVLNGILNVGRRRLVAALHQGLEPFARFMGAAALILALRPTSAVALVGYATGTTVVLASQYAYTRNFFSRQIKNAEPRDNWERQILRFSTPFATWGLFTWAQQASDRWALEVFASTRAVGLYAIVFQLGYYPISLVTATAIQFLAPIFYQRVGSATDSRRNASLIGLTTRLTWSILGITAIAFVVTLLLHREIFRIVVAESYRPASILLPWIVLSGGLFAAGQTIALTLMSQMRPNAMIVAKIATAILGVALNIAGAYFLGLAGVVGATVIFSGFYLVWMTLILRKKVDVTLE
jgi:O-antigen/teichoic acid export membrane protein